MSKKPLTERLPKTSEAFDRWLSSPQNQKLTAAEKVVAERAYYAAWTGLLETIHRLEWSDCGD